MPLRLWSALIPLLLGASTALAADTSDCHLRVGWEEWYPLIYTQSEPLPVADDLPLPSKAEREHLAGSEYALLNSLAERAGCRLSFIEQPWLRALKLLKQGKLDMLYSASRTPEREAFAQFSLPYRVERMVLVVRPEGSPQPARMALRDWLAEPDERGKPHRLGLILGYYYGDILDPIIREPGYHPQLYAVRWDQQLQEMLLHQRIDGYLVETSVAQAQIASTGQPANLIEVSEHRAEPLHLMFARQVSPAIVERFDTAIRSLSTPPDHRAN